MSSSMANQVHLQKLSFGFLKCLFWDPYFLIFILMTFQRFLSYLFLCLLTTSAKHSDPILLQGIVSRDFGTHFLILLDRCEGRNRAGAGLFFLLMTFSCINFKKNYAYAVKILPSKESWNCYHPEDFWNAVRQHSHNTIVKNPGIVTIRRAFGMRCANTRTTWE
jgi:hypothetical protein